MRYFGMLWVVSFFFSPASFSQTEAPEFYRVPSLAQEGQSLDKGIERVGIKIQEDLSRLRRLENPEHIEKLDQRLKTIVSHLVVDGRDRGTTRFYLSILVQILEQRRNLDEEGERFSILNYVEPIRTLRKHLRAEDRQNFDELWVQALSDRTRWEELTLLGSRFRIPLAYTHLVSAAMRWRLIEERRAASDVLWRHMGELEDAFLSEGGEEKLDFLQGIQDAGIQTISRALSFLAFCDEELKGSS